MLRLFTHTTKAGSSTITTATIVSNYTAATGTAIKSSFLPNSYLDPKSRTANVVTDIDLKSFKLYTI